MFTADNFWFFRLSNIITCEFLFQRRCLTLKQNYRQGHVLIFFLRFCTERYLNFKLIFFQYTTFPLILIKTIHTIEHDSPIFSVRNMYYLFISSVLLKKILFFLFLFYYKRSLLLLVFIQCLTVQNMNELFYIQEAKS